MNDIIADIKVGMAKTEGKYVEIPDRREAIRWCLENAQEGDIIVLAGKGHEDYQEIQGEKRPFDERVVIRELLEEMGTPQPQAAREPPKGSPPGVGSPPAVPRLLEDGPTVLVLSHKGKRIPVRVAKAGDRLKLPPAGVPAHRGGPTGRAGQPLPVKAAVGGPRHAGKLGARPLGARSAPELLFYYRKKKGMDGLWRKTLP